MLACASCSIKNSCEARNRLTSSTIAHVKASHANDTKLRIRVGVFPRRRRPHGQAVIYQDMELSMPYMR